MELNNDLFVNIDKETEQGRENFYDEVLEERTKLETKKETVEVSRTTIEEQPGLTGINSRPVQTFSRPSV